MNTSATVSPRVEDDSDGTLSSKYPSRESSASLQGAASSPVPIFDEDVFTAMDRVGTACCSNSERDASAEPGLPRSNSSARLKKPQLVASPFERVGSGRQREGAFTSECRPLQALWAGSGPGEKGLSLEDCMMVDAVMKGDSDRHAYMNAMWHHSSEAPLTYEQCEELAVLGNRSI
jgi:hypothetical protein